MIWTVKLQKDLSSVEALWGKIKPQRQLIINWIRASSFLLAFVAESTRRTRQGLQFPRSSCSRKLTGGNSGGPQFDKEMKLSFEIIILRFHFLAGNELPLGIRLRGSPGVRRFFLSATAPLRNNCYVSSASTCRTCDAKISVKLSRVLCTIFKIIPNHPLIKNSRNNSMTLNTLYTVSWYGKIVDSGYFVKYCNIRALMVINFFLLLPLDWQFSHLVLIWRNLLIIS